MYTNLQENKLTSQGSKYLHSTLFPPGLVTEPDHCDRARPLWQNQTTVEKSQTTVAESQTTVAEPDHCGEEPDTVTEPDHCGEEPDTVTEPDHCNRARPLWQSQTTVAEPDHCDRARPLWRKARPLWRGARPLWQSQTTPPRHPYRPIIPQTCTLHFFSQVRLLSLWSSLLHQRQCLYWLWPYLPTTHLPTYVHNNIANPTLGHYTPLLHFLKRDQQLRTHHECDEGLNHTKPLGLEATSLKDAINGVRSGWVRGEGGGGESG